MSTRGNCTQDTVSLAPGRKYLFDSDLLKVPSDAPADMMDSDSHLKSGESPILKTNSAVNK